MSKIDEILQCLNMDVYQSLDAYSRSDLMLVKKSPYHLKAKRESLYASDEKESSAMLLGELVHCLVLEPDEIVNRYIGAPKVDRRTKEGKAVYAEFLEQAEGKIVVDEDTFEKAAFMASNVAEQQIAQSALKGCLIERSMIWHDDESGLEFKCRPDAYNPENGVVVDLKTTKDASYRGMQGSSARYGYFLQAAMIREALLFHGLRFSKYLLICVESSAPYVYRPLMIGETALDSGLNEFNYLKRKLATCIHENNFEHYPLAELLYPSWAEQDFIEEY